MHRDTRIIRNNTDTAISIWVEPWAFSVELTPRSSAEFVGESASAGSFEVSEEHGNIEIFGWPGSNLIVRVDGETIYETDLRIPGIPSGMDVRGFVDTVFGGKKESK